MRKPFAAVFVAANLFAVQQPPSATFRTGTELVQVSVVAQDKQGKPVSGLRREDFQLFDNGVPQEIRLFVGETAPAASSSPPPARAGAFTNRLAIPRGSHSGYSIILIDNLFSGSDPTNEEGSSLSRSRALEMLRDIPADETIAIYAPGRTLHVICEFTQDRELLVRQLRKWKPSPTTPAAEVDPTLLSQIDPQAQTRGDAAGEVARIEELQHASASDFEMEMLADHLAGIPGRKNLIWLANKFPLGPRALQRLSRAGVSIYPVDIDGVCRLCPARPTQAMDRIAGLTGGIAYYHRNDLAVAMHEAMEDGRVSYTLGFYKSSDDVGVPAVHRFAVKVDRPGVTLRYRTSYETDSPPAAAMTPADLARALVRPIDATAIPVDATVTRMRDSLDFEAVLGVESLGLTPDNHHWTGTFQIVARFAAADGTIASNAFAQTLTLNLPQDDYEAAVRGGLAYHNQWEIPSKAASVKVLFANPASGRLGSITIPLSKVPARPAATQ